MYLKLTKLLKKNIKFFFFIKIIKILGEGTFGRVFEVKEIYTNKIYALKMIRAVDRFI